MLSIVPKESFLVTRWRFWWFDKDGKSYETDRDYPDDTHNLKIPWIFKREKPECVFVLRWRKIRDNVRVRLCIVNHDGTWKSWSCIVEAPKVMNRSTVYKAAIEKLGDLSYRHAILEDYGVEANGVSLVSK